MAICFSPAEVVEMAERIIGNRSYCIATAALEYFWNLRTGIPVFVKEFLAFLTKTWVTHVLGLLDLCFTNCGCSTSVTPFKKEMVESLWLMPKYSSKTMKRSFKLCRRVFDDLLHVEQTLWILEHWHSWMSVKGGRGSWHRSWFTGWNGWTQGSLSIRLAASRNDLRRVGAVFVSFFASP